MGKREKPRHVEYFKRLVNFLIVNGVAWVWCSYLLAYLGREQIAESLSNNAVDSIIAVAFAYAFKSLCENTLKYNNFTKKKSKDPDDTVYGNEEMEG